MPQSPLSAPLRPAARTSPKGRALDAAAVADVEALLAGKTNRRDHLIEYLHALQDHFGALHARHLKALAEWMRVSEAEIFEVASFYAHFDYVREGERAPPALTLRVCTSVSCQLAGAQALLAALRAGTDPRQIRVLEAPCIGQCDAAPAVLVGHNPVRHADAARVLAVAKADTTQPDLPAYTTLEAYRAGGGYQVLAEVLAGKRAPETIIATLLEAGLRGLGGAGFPAGRKWQTVRAAPAPRLMTINADEGEPGTFKDRALLESDPHRMLEGALIAAHCVAAERIYLYIRDEYTAARLVLAREIEALAQAGLLSTPIEVRRGAGAYICGEESAMLASIEGGRGLPRHRPPLIAENGLFGRPTLNHNVETLAWIRDILALGAQAFAAQGRNGGKGLRAYSVSGRVQQPGVKHAPAGITASALIEDYCGGMAEGHILAGFLPGGASGGMLPASLANIPLDFGTLDAYGAFVGSHALVVFSHADDPQAIALNLLAFFAEESCGQCTPCRVGCETLHALIAHQKPEGSAADTAVIADLEHAMRLGSICGLGQAAPNPARSWLRFFASQTSPDLVQPNLAQPEAKTPALLPPSPAPEVSHG